MVHHSCLILLLIGLLCCRYNTADAADTLSCVCTCCPLGGISCLYYPPTGTFTLTNCSEGCTSNECKIRYPSQCSVQNVGVITTCEINKNTTSSTTTVSSSGSNFLSTTIFTHATGNTASCTCTCCNGRFCTPTTVDNFTVTSCKSGDCSENICRTRFPLQCPAEGQNGAIINTCIGSSVTTGGSSVTTDGSGDGNGSATNVKVAAFGVYVVLMSVVATVNFLF